MIDKKKLLKLRKQTSLGMMTCTKALKEANGDFDKAIEILRKQGKKIANKKLGREIEQGSIFAKTNPEKSVGVLIGLGCETDFVAKSDQFLTLSEYIMNIALSQRPGSKEELLNLRGDKKTVEEEIVNLIGVLGENISLEEYYILEGDLVGSYVHTGNKLGAVVVLNQPGDSDEKIKAATDMALQVVASGPLGIREEDIDSAILEKERELVQKELAVDNKTPEEVKKKVERRIKKFVEKNTLLSQPFVKDERMTNQAYLTSIAPGFSVIRFKRAIVAS